jgi:ABC-type antimicrobial peptide transport system permease subunit
MKIIWLFCEGPHDAGFLTRVLTTFEYLDKSAEYTLETIEKVNKPLHTLLNGYLRQYASLGYKLDKFPSRPSIFKKNEEKDTWILLYLTDGNTNFQKVYDILRPFLLSKLSSNNNSFQDIKTAIAFINDADNGLEKAIEDLIKAIEKAYRKELQKFEYKKIDPEKLGYKQSLTLFQNLPHQLPIQHILVDTENTIFQKQGYYILCKDDLTGKLEDIILPMMEMNNIDVFEKSKQFINDNNNKDNLDIQKATIGVAGQLEMAGYANGVIIQKGSYLTREKIINSSKCQEIISFINEMANI